MSSPEPQNRPVGDGLTGCGCPMARRQGFVSSDPLAKEAGVFEQAGPGLACVLHHL